MGRRKLTFVLVVVMGLMFVPAAASAGSSYSIGLFPTVWGEAGYQNGSITVTYAIRREQGVPVAAQTDVENAIEQWNECFNGQAGCAGISPAGHFSFVPATGAPLLSITIKKGGGRRIWGRTTGYTDKSGFIKDVGVQIDTASSGSPHTDLEITKTALVELGHAVPLDHSNDPNDAMDPNTDATSFGSCEVNGFNALYSSWLGTSDPQLPSQTSVSC